MGTVARCVLIAVVLSEGGRTAYSSSTLVTDRSAEQILKELDEIKIPKNDASRKNDQDYVRQFTVELRETTEKRAALISELNKVAPDHDRIPSLVAERWSVRPFGLAADELQKEIESILAHTQNPMLKTEGVFARTYARLYDSRL